MHVRLPILAADGSNTLVPGVLPVALRMDFWSDPSFPVAAADGTTTASPPAANDGSGNIKRESDGVVVAYASDVNAAGESIGDVVVPSGDAGVTDGAVGYLPIVADTFSDAPALHVIGFGFVRINVGADGTLTFSKLTRAGGYVAPLNATSNLAQAWLSLPSADRDAIYQANRQLSNPAADPDLPPDAAPVLCPVLVRSRGD